MKINVVLNLIINGIPSIQKKAITEEGITNRFKPYYKWNTFNTGGGYHQPLVKYSFKPYYKWNTFNT